MQPVPTLAEPEQKATSGGPSHMYTPNGHKARVHHTSLLMVCSVHPKRAQGTGSPHLSPHGLLWN